MPDNLLARIKEWRLLQQPPELQTCTHDEYERNPQAMFDALIVDPRSDIAHMHNDSVKASYADRRHEWGAGQPSRILPESFVRVKGGIKPGMKLSVFAPGFDHPLDVADSAAAIMMVGLAQLAPHYDCPREESWPVVAIANGLRYVLTGPGGQRELELLWAKY